MEEKTFYSVNEFMNRFGKEIVNTDFRGVIEIGSLKVGIDKQIISEIEPLIANKDIDSINKDFYIELVQVPPVPIFVLKKTENSISNTRFPMMFSEVTISNIEAQIKKCSSINELNGLFNQLSKTYKHPSVPFLFSCALEDEFRLGNYEYIYSRLLLEGGSYGIQYPCEFYDEKMICYVGMSFFTILKYFALHDDDIEIGIKLYLLAYLYLSKPTRILPPLLTARSYNSYGYRSFLCTYVYFYATNSEKIDKIFTNYLGSKIDMRVLAIHDYHNQSVYGSENRNGYREAAKNLYEELNISSRCSYNQIIEIGKDYHNEIFLAMEKDYKNGKFNVSKKVYKKML